MLCGSRITQNQNWCQVKTMNSGNFPGIASPTGSPGINACETMPTPPITRIDNLRNETVAAATNTVYVRTIKSSNNASSHHIANICYSLRLRTRAPMSTTIGVWSNSRHSSITQTRRRLFYHSTAYTFAQLLSSDKYNNVFFEEIDLVLWDKIEHHYLMFGTEWPKK